MTVRSYGPTVLPVHPRTAADVKVTYRNGVVPTFTTPITVDPTTKAVSFALDDGGTPPIELIMTVQPGPGMSATTIRVTLPTSTAPVSEAARVGVSPSGLIIVTGTDVQAALAELDAAVHTVTQNTRFTNDLIGNRPTPSAYGVGWYWASDDNGGTLYHSDGTTWTKITHGITWASGTQLGYASDPNLSFDAKANGNPWNDLSAALRVSVPASAVPVKIRGRVWGQSATGTAAAGTMNNLQLRLTDNAGVMQDIDSLPAMANSAASTVTYMRKMDVEITLPAPVAAQTYKLQGRVNPATVAAWASANFLGQAPGNTFPLAELEAVAQ